MQLVILTKPLVELVLSFNGHIKLEVGIFVVVVRMKHNFYVWCFANVRLWNIDLATELAFRFEMNVQRQFQDMHSSGHGSK